MVMKIKSKTVSKRKLIKGTVKGIVVIVLVQLFIIAKFWIDIYQPRHTDLHTETVYVENVEYVNLSKGEEMISIYDLYDLHSILVGIRFAPQSRINKAVVSKAIEVLENRHKNNDFNQFRKAIHSIALLDDNKLYDWAEVEN